MPTRMTARPRHLSMLRSYTPAVRGEAYRQIFTSNTARADALAPFIEHYNI